MGKPSWQLEEELSAALNLIGKMGKSIEALEAEAVPLRKLRRLRDVVLSEYADRDNGTDEQALVRIFAAAGLEQGPG